MLFFLAVAALFMLFFLSSKNWSNSYKKFLTRVEVITFSIPNGWVVCKTNANYDIDIGYSQNRGGERINLYYQCSCGKIRQGSDF